MDDSSNRLAAAESSLRSVLSSGRGAFVDGKGIRWVMHRDISAVELAYSYIVFSPRTRTMLTLKAT